MILNKFQQFFNTFHKVYHTCLEYTSLNIVFAITLLFLEIYPIFIETLKWQKIVYNQSSNNKVFEDIFTPINYLFETCDANKCLIDLFLRVAFILTGSLVISYILTYFNRISNFIKKTLSTYIALFYHIFY